MLKALFFSQKNSSRWEIVRYSSGINSISSHPPKQKKTPLRTRPPYLPLLANYNSSQNTNNQIVSCFAKPSDLVLRWKTRIVNYHSFSFVLSLSLILILSPSLFCRSLHDSLSVLSFCLIKV